MSLHPKPDGDSLGACTAMKYVLETQGKIVALVSKDNLSDNLAGMKISKEVEFGKDISEMDWGEFDTVIFLDHGTLKYYSKDMSEKMEKNKVINIDHHHTNEYFGNLNYVDSKSPSCCSILVDFFKIININFDKELSRRLFLGICTDTFFFVHGNSLDSIKKAEFLIEQGGINYAKEFFEPINSESWGIKKLHGILLSNMEKREVDGINIAYSFVTKEDIEKHGLNESDIRLGIMCMQDLKNVPVAFTLTELDGGIKGSFRSKGIDTSLFAQKLGGGGHKEASAFYIEKMSLNQAIEKVFEVIEKIRIHKV